MPVPDTDVQISMVLSGGIGLGAYQAGAYAALHTRTLPAMLAGSSAGAINAALIAGNPPDARIDRLRAFWRADEQSWQPLTPPAMRHLQNWMSVLQARVLGSAGHFHPRLQLPLLHDFMSLYDLSPMRARLRRLIDFERLNGGDVRLAVAMTDIESGDEVIVDTGRGDRVTLDHLLASCGFLPEFAPVEIGDRSLGDGGLAANAPVDAVLRSGSEQDMVCFVVDLFARDGPRPRSYESASERKSDFGNQTWQRLEGLRREHALCTEISTLAQLGSVDGTWDSHTERLANQGRRAIQVLYLSYRSAADEPGPEKTFDLSATTIARRWRYGWRDMEEALRIADSSTRQPGLHLHKIRLADPALPME